MVNVSIHQTQFPQAVDRELLHCLRARDVNPKFHYLTYKQSETWLELHRAYSPSRTDAECAAIYDTAFAAAARLVANEARINVLGLGCGGGQKDARLLRLLAHPSRRISYVPCDVSVALVLTAREAAAEAAPNVSCHPLICDLAQTRDLANAIDVLVGADALLARPSRLVTFFGMVPNFKPTVILPRVTALLSENCWLLLSANLAPGPDYGAGMQTILPGYDNTLTRHWLMMFLTDLGVERSDGTIQFGIEDGQESLKRVVADFIFSREKCLGLQGETFAFKPGDKIRLFYSYRYTPARLGALLEPCGARIVNQWIATSGEEGVFLCKGAG